MLAYLKLVKIAFVSVVMFCGTVVFAQQPAPLSLQDSSRSYKPSTSNLCSNDMILARQRKDPAFKAREELMNSQILTAATSLPGDTITVPVVFHIVNNDPNSVTDLQITNALKDLNEAFSKSGKYAGSAGVDTKIRFCLSQKDPDGGNTTGITRTKSFFSTHLNKDIEDARLKNLIQWDPSKYINIWFISSIDAEAYADFVCGTWFRLGMAGYATMPPGGDPLDGIVVTGFGVLLAHEMGHYLGLYHTFEGWCTNNNCATDGDRVCDTPPDGSLRPSGSCGSPGNSCSSDTLSNYSNGLFPTDVPDQISNFMDYGNSACTNQFTQGQADRMRAAIQTQRSGLLEEKCFKPCPDNIIAAFTRNAAYPLPGDRISFTNKSTGGNNYHWFVNDVQVSTSPDFEHTFNAVGKYKVTLKTFSTPNCFAAYSDYIIVTCGVTARFYTNKKTVASKLNIYTDTIIFTNTSYNGQSFKWLMSHDQGMAEQVVSTDRHLTYVFPTPATYLIKLVATNGSCSDTTGVYTVPVLEPTADGVPYAVSLSCYQQDKVQVSFCMANYGFAPLPVNSSVNFYDADPRVAGAKKLGTTFKLPYPVPGNCYVCFSHILNIPYRGLEKVFVVYNDTGTVVPVVLPNTSFVEKEYGNNFAVSPPTRKTVTASICAGQSLLGYNKSGTYYDTLTNTNGCEYIRTLELTVKPVYEVTVTTSICEGENYAGHMTSGTFVDVYPAINGCDSTRTLHLTVKPQSRTTISAIICEGENYAGHATSGTFKDVYKALNGCDSTRTLHLTVNPKKTTTINKEICQGESYLAARKLQITTGVYYDTLKTYLGCDSVIVTNLTVNPIPLPDLGKDRGVCAGDTLVLNPGIFSTYLWQDGTKGPDFRTNAIGTYSVTVSNTFGCKAADTMRLLGINPLPVNFLPDDTSLCKGNILKVQVTGFITYNWNNGGNRWFVDVTKSGNFKLDVTDRNGCKGSDSMNVIFKDNCVVIQIPNAFTPGNDGRNDMFTPFIPAPLPDYRLQVFNRWGQIVFETKDYKQGWDGMYQSKPQSPGTYVYMISFKDFDGINVKKSGTLILIR